MLETPVVLLVFNRPETTRMALEPVRRARPRTLFVVADGPRASRPEDKGRCAAVRALVELGVDWPCDLRTEYAAQNLGCARRVSSGLDWVFSQVEEAIILEDDCVAHDTFFPYCEQMLARYRSEPRVAQIAGCSFQPSDPAKSSRYYFSRYPHCWGWATWRHSWRHYDHAMTAWPDRRDAPWFRQTIEHRSERRRWAESFDRVAEGRVDSWAYRWTLSVWRRGCLSINSHPNLVSNIGFGQAATHTRVLATGAALPLSPIIFPLTHPAAVVRDVAADNHTSRLLFRPPSLGARLRYRVSRLFAS